MNSNDKTKIMNRFIPLVLSVVMMYGGCQLFEINKGKANEGSKELQKGLCENGVKAKAIIQNEYTEMEVGSSVSYQYKFDYEVDGKPHTGNITKNEELTIPIVEITYDKNNPATYSTGDPCKTYERIKDLPGKWPQWFEYVGAGIFLLGLGYIQSAIVHLIRGNKGA